MESNGTYKLSIFERIRLVNIYLPQAQGSLLTLKLANDTLSNLGVTQEEIDYYELKQLDNGRLSFNTGKMFTNGNPNKPETKEFEIPKAVVEIIKKQLESQDAQEQLGFETYSLYEKFVIDKDNGVD